EELKCLWLVEHQRWDEAADALRFASQCRFCQLPAIITREDLQRHRTKQVAFLAEPRVVALWKMLGRQVDFGELGRFELFDDGHGSLRAIKDEEAFQIRLSPPLPPAHRYQQHSDPHNPIVAHRIDVYYGQDHVRDGDMIEASFSSYLMHTMTARMSGSCSLHLMERGDMIDAGVMARLDRSVHRPFVGNVAGASAVMALEYPANVYHRYVVMTPLDHPFATVFCLDEIPLDDQEVHLVTITKEPKASVPDDELRFSQMHPQTTAVASRFFGLILGGDDEDDTSSSSGSEEGEEGGGGVSTHDDGSTSHDADTENDDDAPAIANTGTGCANGGRGQWRRQRGQHTPMNNQSGRSVGASKRGSERSELAS
ncbi:unnamed protein product, partial [Vitrella brassicaformis CCMP3155]